MYIIIIISIIILLLFGFCYYSTSNSLELYHVYDFDNNIYSTLKNLKNPALFTFKDDFDTNLISNYENHYLNIVIKNEKKRIKLKEWLSMKEVENEEISMNNRDFLNYTLLKYKLRTVFKKIEQYEPFYEDANIYFMGNKNYSKLKYDYAKFVYLRVLKGTIQLKLLLPNRKDITEEYIENDEEYFGKYDPWNNDIIECLTVLMKTDDTIKIPRFWWYSFKGIEDDSIVYMYSGDSILSRLLTNPYLLQLSGG